MSNLSYALIMLIAGVGIPMLAALNAALGHRIGSPAAAASILFGLAFAIMIVAMLITGTGVIKNTWAQPWHLYFAGVFVAFYVLSVTYIAPHFGVGNAVFFVLLGQLISAAIIDHFGLFGAREAPITAMRGLGIAVMAFGVFLTQRS